MSVDKNNIEELFKSTFENFESEVDPSVWQQVQANLQSGSASSPDLMNTAGQSVVKSAIKWAAAVGIGGAVVVSSYVLLSDDEQASPSDVSEQQIEQIEEVESATLTDESDKISIPEEPRAIQNKDIQQEVVQDRENPSESSSLDAEETVQDLTQDAGIDLNESNVVNAPVVTSNESTSETEVINVEESIVESKSEETSVASLPKAKITANKTKGKLPLEVQLRNTGTPGNCSWFIKGTGIQWESNQVEHIFERSGSYWVILAVEGENHQLAMDSIQITVEADYKINYPKVFTPNGDGSNDTWKIQAENLSEIHWYIMNRAGQIVFEWDSLEGFWDGRDRSGNMVPEGAYFFVIEGKTATGDPIYPEKGVVNIFK